MTASSVWLSDLVARCPRVLGKQLLPLQVGHPRLLAALGSPLLKQKTVTAGDLAVAVWVCSRSYEQGLAALPRLTTRKFQRWGVAMARRDLQAEGERFAAYMADHLREPEAWTSAPQSAEPSGSPWWHRVHWALVHYKHLTEMQAWCHGMAAGLLWYANTAEMIHGAKLESDEQIEARRNRPPPRYVGKKDG